MSDECPCCRSVSAIGWLERAISALQEESALHAKIEERQAAEIAALREKNEEQAAEIAALREAARLAYHWSEYFKRICIYNEEGLEADALSDLAKAAVRRALEEEPKP